MTEDVGSFAAFQVLENMKMAPIHRVPKETLPSTCVELDTLMSDQVFIGSYVVNLRLPGCQTRSGSVPLTVIADVTFKQNENADLW